MPGTSTILVVEDDRADRMALTAQLSQFGHNVLEAENGKVAIEVVENHKIDLVLMDLMMPVMDGYEATPRVKKAAKGFLPVMFVTSMSNDRYLARCLDAGGDDFLSKPYNEVVLKAKVESMLRIRKLQKEINMQHRELTEYHAIVQEEQEVARKVFDRIVESRVAGKKAGLKMSMSPMSIFNGDMILTNCNQTGGVDMLLADFTGHGLTAAIGSIPVANIFTTMSQKGFSHREILEEINAKLMDLLPVGMFMACVFASIDRINNIITVINAGLPAVYLYSEKNLSIKKTYKSSNLPLGVQNISAKDLVFDIESLEYDDRLIVYTDGVLETENLKGQHYGKDRLLNCLTRSDKGDLLFDCILNDCNKFRGEAEQTDDITLMELCHLDHVEYEERSEKQAVSSKPSNWNFSMELEPATIKSFDPLPFVINGISTIQPMSSTRSIMQTVLTEIMANAIDHGLLSLDSTLKHSAEGFVEFYKQREKRLSEMTNGSIKIDISHTKTGKSGGLLTIRVTDSGKGFDPDAMHKKVSNDNLLSGRGLHLLSKLCKTLTFNDKGNQIEATIDWS